MPNWGLLGAVGEGLKSGVESYRTERDYQTKKALEEADRKQKDQMMQADFLSKGLLRNESGLISKTPEQTRREAVKDASERSGLLSHGYDLGELDQATGQYGLKETKYGEAKTRKTLAEAEEAEAKARSTRSGRDPSKVNEYGTTLRNEFQKHPDVVTANSVQAAYDKMIAASSDPSGASDMSLIFGYMKMQDPNSTVREGEYASAKDTGGIPASIVNAYNKAVDGQFLTPKQRQDFLRQAASMAKVNNARLEARKKDYEDFADQYGVPRGHVFARNREQKSGLIGGGSPPIEPGAANADFQPGQTRTNRRTGEVQEWDGQGWVSRGRR